MVYPSQIGANRPLRWIWWPNALLTALLVIDIYRSIVFCAREGIVLGFAFLFSMRWLWFASAPAQLVRNLFNVPEAGPSRILNYNVYYVLGNCRIGGKSANYLVVVKRLVSLLHGLCLFPFIPLFLILRFLLLHPSHLLQLLVEELSVSQNLISDWLGHQKLFQFEVIQVVEVGDGW